jgi:hypothetical protein
MQPTNWDYTRLEFERKFLVDPSRLDSKALERYSKLLEDRYFDFGRLRLRRQADSDTGLVKFKLTKKFDLLSETSGRSAVMLPEVPQASSSVAPGYVRRIVSMWLSEAEYAALRMLPGQQMRKRRHYFKTEGLSFGVDVFEGALEGLMICEFEGENEQELFSIQPPPFATVEVTLDPFFTGGNLCRTSAEKFSRKMASFQA